MPGGTNPAGAILRAKAACHNAYAYPGQWFADYQNIFLGRERAFWYRGAGWAVCYSFGFKQAVPALCRHNSLYRAGGRDHHGYGKLRQRHSLGGRVECFLKTDCLQKRAGVFRGFKAEMLPRARGSYPALRRAGDEAYLQQVWLVYFLYSVFFFGRGGR